MAEIDSTLKEVLLTGREMGGRLYATYRAKQETPHQTRAEIVRKKKLKAIKRRVRGRIGSMAALPYLTIAPILANLFGGNILTLAGAGGALIGFIAGLHQLRLGLKLEAEEVAAQMQSLPPPDEISGPHKAMGLIFLGLGMFSFAWISQPFDRAFSISGLALGAAAFAVGIRGIFGRSAQVISVQPSIDKAICDTPLGVALLGAQEKLYQIYQASTQMHQEGLRRQVLGVHEAAQAVVDELHDKPNDLAKARRFLVTYLESAAKLVLDFANQTSRSTKGELEEKFSETLITIEKTFVAQLHKLRADEDLDLDIQMDVLESQMKAEGVS